MNTIYEQIQKLLKKCENDSTVMPPTILFNEGWMLRLILSSFEKLTVENNQHPLSIPSGCKWYSEALLPSAFLAEYRGDSRSESWTHADGVIGNFDIGDKAKGDLSLKKDATHFVVTEAKMFSKLSSGVKNAPYFNQAARNIACMAEVLKRADRHPDDLDTLGFYVLAPASQITQGIFKNHLDKGSLHRTVERRISEYEGARDQWLSEWYLPTEEKIEVRTISWEDLIDFVLDIDSKALDLKNFYSKCVEFNKLRTEVIH